MYRIFSPRRLVVLLCFCSVSLEASSLSQFDVQELVRTFGYSFVAGAPNDSLPELVGDEARDLVAMLEGKVPLPADVSMFCSDDYMCIIRALLTAKCVAYFRREGVDLSDPRAERSFAYLLAMKILAKGKPGVEALNATPTNKARKNLIVEKMREIFPELSVGATKIERFVGRLETFTNQTSFEYFDERVAYVESYLAGIPGFGGQHPRERASLYELVPWPPLQSFQDLQFPAILGHQLPSFGQQHADSLKGFGPLRNFEAGDLMVYDPARRRHHINVFTVNLVMLAVCWIDNHVIQVSAENSSHPRWFVPVKGAFLTFREQSKPPAEVIPVNFVFDRIDGISAHSLIVWILLNSQQHHKLFRGGWERLDKKLISYGSRLWTVMHFLTRGIMGFAHSEPLFTNNVNRLLRISTPEHRLLTDKPPSTQAHILQSPIASNDVAEQCRTLLGRHDYHNVQDVSVSRDGRFCAAYIPSETDGKMMVVGIQSESLREVPTALVPSGEIRWVQFDIGYHLAFFGHGQGTFGGEVWFFCPIQFAVQRLGGQKLPTDRHGIRVLFTPYWSVRPVEPGHPLPILMPPDVLRYLAVYIGYKFHPSLSFMTFYPNEPGVKVVGVPSSSG